MQVATTPGAGCGSRTATCPVTSDYQAQVNVGVLENGRSSVGRIKRALRGGGGFSRSVRTIGISVYLIMSSVELRESFGFEEAFVRHMGIWGQFYYL